MTPSPEVREGILRALPRLRAFAVALTHNGTSADDLVQDTILRAWKHIDRFDAGTCLDAWLFTILRNQFYSGCSKTGREVQDSDGSFAARLWAPPEQPARCDAQDLLSALARLSPEQREALLLVATEGLSYEEAAQVCGVAIGTIKSRTYRARAGLARLLAVHDVEDLGPDRVTQAALQTAI